MFLGKKVAKLKNRLVMILGKLVKLLTLNQIVALLALLPEGGARHQVTELRDRVETQRGRLLADQLRRHLLLIQHQGNVHWALA